MMKIILNDFDYIEAITPFRSGCSFHAIIKEDGVYFDIGCYLPVKLICGAKLELYKRYLETDGRFKIECSQELRLKFLSMTKKCRYCGRTVILEAEKHTYAAQNIECAPYGHGLL